MQVLDCELPDVKVLVPRVHADERGVFVETYQRERYRELGIAVEFVQDNLSVSRRTGTVRGLHFQTEPFAQAKLVRVVRGRILDVAVDLRRSSPRFGRSVAVELSAENWKQLFVPVGFAHGFCTLEPDTEVAYKVSSLYAPQHDAGLIWNDPDLGIDWPVGADEAVLSDKDRQLPRLRDVAITFD